MKKNILYIGSLVMLLASACTDLDEKLYDKVEMSSYGKTPEEIKTIAGGAYATLRGYAIDASTWNAPFEFYFFVNEVSSNECVTPTRLPNDWYDQGIYLDLQRHIFSPSNELFYRAWNYNYSGISYVNQIIATVESSDMSVEQKAVVNAEMRGVRAYYYYRLCDYFGNVPLQVDFYDLEKKPNTPRADVFKFIESELLAVLDKLPTEGYGRFTQNAGYTLLARLYLNAEVYTGTARWEDCLAACDKVKNCLLEPDFKTNFRKNNEISRENIFVIPYDEKQFSSLSQGAFYQQSLMLHYNANQKYGTPGVWYVNGMAAEPGVYSKFEAKDARIYCMDAGPQFKPDGSPVLDRKGNPLVYTETIANIEGATEGEGVRMVKYVISSDDKLSRSHDYVLMRYAEIVLMKAECSLRLGNDALAAQFINEIRARAGVDPIAKADMNALDDELLREFLFEEHRRTDNIRLGRFNIAQWEQPANPKEKEIFPIPAKILNENDKLVQNPGY